MYRVSFCFLLGISSFSCNALDEVVFVNNDISPRYCQGKTAYIGRDHSYRIRVPNLAKTVYVQDRFVSGSPTAHVAFISLDYGFLYVVSTRIRDGLDHAEVLDRVAAKYVNYPNNYRGAFQSKWSDGKLGRAFDFVFLNALAPPGDSVPYPIALAYAGGNPEEPKTVAVHRFVVGSGYLFEFSALLHTRAALAGKTKDELIRTGYGWINHAMVDFVPGRVESCDELKTQASQVGDAPK